MSFISSKFNMPTYSGSGCANQQIYAELYLTKLKNAFIDANSAWTLYSDIETFGTYTGTTAGIRTLQLKSNTSNKYVRIWAFANVVSSNIVTSATVTTDPPQIYSGNLFVQNDGSNQNRYRFGEYSEIYFGVSSNPIDPDPAIYLGLDLPMFGITNGLVGSNLYLSYFNYGAYRYGAIISVITDGSMFAVMSVCNGNLRMCLYAPDLFICANSADGETAGVISNNQYYNNFYLGDDDNNNNTMSAIFNAADGEHNFNGMMQNFNNGRLNSRILTAESSTKMVCAPVCFWMAPYNYSGSTMTAITNGIGFKGWINTDYIRSVDSRVLPFASKGMKYGNGGWLCVDTGTLICWDDSNTSPFEAA